MNAATRLTPVPGQITPVGVPEDWRLLVDAAVMASGPAIIGSGLRLSKILLPGELLATLTRAKVVDRLGLPVA